jgi:regulator of sigma E protease
MPMVVERNGQQIPLTFVPSSHVENGDVAGSLDFTPDYGGLPVIVSGVDAGSPAAETGLQDGDRLLSIGDQPVKSSVQVIEYIRNHDGQRIPISVQRNGQTAQLTTPERRLEGNRLGFGVKELFPVEKATIGSAMAYAYDTNLQILRLTGKALGQVFTGKRSFRNTVSGPIGIYQAAQSSVERLGWGGVFGMLGFLSLNLGIFNLLPIPVLDGGAIFLLLIEGLLGLGGLTLSTAVRDRIQQVGFVMVLLLMVFVITNDVIKTFGGGGSRQQDKPPATAPAK